LLGYRKNIVIVLQGVGEILGLRGSGGIKLVGESSLHLEDPGVTPAPSLEEEFITKQSVPTRVIKTN
jgi:hypothetical protein